MTITRNRGELTVKLNRISVLPDTQADKQAMVAAIVSSDLYRRSVSYQAHSLAARPTIGSWLACGLRFFPRAIAHQRIG